MDEAMKAARNIRRVRRLLDMTQIDLAEKAGLSKQTISNIETGRHSLMLSTALHIADALELSVEQLVGRDSISRHL